MSFEVFEKLEAKVQQAVDTIQLLQMEMEDLKEQNQALEQQVQQNAAEREAMLRERFSLARRVCFGRGTCSHQSYYNINKKTEHYALFFYGERSNATR